MLHVFYVVPLSLLQLAVPSSLLLHVNLSCTLSSSLPSSLSLISSAGLSARYGSPKRQLQFYRYLSLSLSVCVYSGTRLGLLSHTSQSESSSALMEFFLVTVWVISSQIQSLLDTQLCCLQCCSNAMLQSALHSAKHFQIVIKVLHVKMTSYFSLKSVLYSALPSSVVSGLSVLLFQRGIMFYGLRDEALFC